MPTPKNVKTSIGILSECVMVLISDVPSIIRWRMQAVKNGERGFGIIIALRKTVAMPYPYVSPVMGFGIARDYGAGASLSRRL